MDYRTGSHTVYNIEYHFVWVTKYRYKVLTGDVAVRVRELVRQTYEAFEIRILSGVVSLDRSYHGMGATWTRSARLASGLPVTLTAGLETHRMAEHRQGFVNDAGTSGVGWRYADPACATRL